MRLKVTIIAEYEVWDLEGYYEKYGKDGEPIGPAPTTARVIELDKEHFEDDIERLCTMDYTVTVEEIA